MKVNQINLEDNYGEGDIPVNTKTGTRDFNIAGSYPYIRNYLNELPVKSEPNAFLFQSHKNGAPLHSDTMTALFKHLRRHIIKLLDINKITDEEECNKLQAIVRNKIWNMYCLRHSALTDKFDVLERGELVQIAGWSPNTKQDKRYIKSRVSRNTKRKLLHQAGIITKQEADPEPRTNICPCGYTNTHEAARCVKCNFALSYKGWKAAKQNEEQSATELKHRMEEEISSKIELEFESRLVEIQNNFSRQQEEEMNRRNVDQERLARMEKAIEVMANGKATFEMKKNGASKDMTLIPMQEFIFDKNLTRQELETQVREILLGQRKPNGPVEYRIVPKNMKPNAFLLADKQQSMDSGVVISPTSQSNE
jgi:hypothetical protein